MGARVAQWVRSLDLTTHTSLSPIRRGFAPGFVNYKKECTRLAAASDKIYQLLAQGRWFSPASSTTKTGHHDIAEILLKVALNTKIQIQMLVWPSWILNCSNVVVLEKKMSKMTRPIRGGHVVFWIALLEDLYRNISGNSLKSFGFIARKVFKII